MCVGTRCDKSWIYNLSRVPQADGDDELGLCDAVVAEHVRVMHYPVDLER